MTHNYDDRILAALASGPRRFAGICMALDIDPKSRAHAPEWRVVDRRLQALRRAGKIEIDRAGWQLVTRGKTP